MKEEAAHTPTRVDLHHFFRRSAYKQPVLVVLGINLGCQLSGFPAVSPRLSSGRLAPATPPKKRSLCLQIINYSTRMFEARFAEAKRLTLWVGAVNVAFTLVAVGAPFIRRPSEGLEVLWLELADSCYSSSS